MNSQPDLKDQNIADSGGLPGLSLRRPVTMLMFFAAFVVVGLMSLRNIPIQMLPSGFDPPFLWIWMSYPNSSPMENLDRIGRPVEEEFSTIKGLRRIQLRARPNGCGIFLEFQRTADMDLAYMEVRDRLERVKPRLPDDFRYAFIRRYSENDEPVVYMGISIIEPLDDPYRLIQDEVVKPLERVDGVAAVEVWGGTEKLVRIELVLDRLKAHNLDINQLVRTLRAAEFSIAGGEVNDAGRRLLVRIDGRITSLDALRRLPVKGSELFLGDIAKVSFTEPETDWVQRIGRKSAVQIGVMKQAEVNAVGVTDKISEVIDQFRHNPQLDGLQFDVLFNQGDVIRASIGNLSDAGLWGALFAIIVLYLFLRRMRMTLFITLAIPISLMFTITCLYFADWSLNIVTLSGLMISVGMVVDNAIVVVENIDVRKREGMSDRKAALKGASEVALAITLATMTTVVVFLPLMLLAGDRIMSFYMLRIGVPVILSLIASLFVALLLIPLAVSRFAMGGRPHRVKSIANIESLVGRWTGWVVNNRGLSAFIFILLLGSNAIPISQVVSTDEQEGHINDFTLRFGFPAYYDLAAIDSTMNRLEKMLYENRARFDIKTVVTGFRVGFARVRVFLNEPPKRQWFEQGIRRLFNKLKLTKPQAMERQKVIETVKKEFQLPADVELFTSWRRGRGDESAVYVSVFGEDMGILSGIAYDIQHRLEQMPGVISIEQDLESETEEVAIHYDRNKTTQFGIETTSASFGLMSLIRGVELNKLRLDGSETGFRVELQEADRASLPQVLNLPAGGSFNNVIRLDDVATVGYARGLGEITRENRRTRISLKIVTSEDDIGKFSRRIDGALAGLNIPPGYEWGKGQRFQEVEEASRQRNQAWMLAVMFVLLLMGALFESFLLPLAVIVTVPFSFIGVWWGLYLTGTQFGIMAGIGVVVLIGVVVNNAIVLVDKVNRLRAEGLPRAQALIIASQIRFRPIAMTALTTIMGLIPMAVGESDLVGIPYSPMGRVLIGGMLTATLTTPLMVPLAYCLIDDFKIWIESYRNKLINVIKVD